VTYLLELSDLVKKKFKKMDKFQLSIIDKKIKKILQNPYHFKPLRGDLHGARRVHLETSYVLVYEIIEDRKTVRILDYDHHDEIYE
jgi:mRNA interferase RelE/StbE/toxin YoeB